MQTWYSESFNMHFFPQNCWQGGRIFFQTIYMPTYIKILFPKHHIYMVCSQCRVLCAVLNKIFDCENLILQTSQSQGFYPVCAPLCTTSRLEEIYSFLQTSHSYKPLFKSVFFAVLLNYQILKICSCKHHIQKVYLYYLILQRYYAFLQYVFFCVLL